MTDQYLTISAAAREAVDEHGDGPSVASIKTYVRDGLLTPVRDSSRRMLFTLQDAKSALQIYKMRKARHGNVGVRKAPPAADRDRHERFEALEHVR